jgi:hypothetical protein
MKNEPVNIRRFIAAVKTPMARKARRQAAAAPFTAPLIRAGG